MFEMMPKLLIVIFFAFVVAHFIGKRRLIGFKWSFLFSLVLSPIIGLIISLSSRKNDGLTKIQPSETKKRWGYALLILSVLSAVKILMDFIESNDIKSFEFVFCFVAFIWGGFLLERSKGL